MPSSSRKARTRPSMSRAFRRVLASSISRRTTGAAQAIHTVPNDLSTANIYVSLTTDEDDNLIITWLDGYRSQYMFYALADSDGNVLTPATIFQRTRHSYLWSSWNGYGNDRLSIPQVAAGLSTIYLPIVIKNYPPPPPPQPVNNGQLELGDFSHWTVGGDETGVWLGGGEGCVAVGNAARVAATPCATRVWTALSPGVAGDDGPANLQDINSMVKIIKRERTCFLRILAPSLKRPSKGRLPLSTHYIILHTTRIAIFRLYPSE